jgi:hypothetical protein
MFEKDGNVCVIRGLENQYLLDLLKRDALGGRRIASVSIVEG